MSLVSLLIWVIVFALAVAIVGWLVKEPQLRKIFYVVLAIIALVVPLQAVGLFGGGPVIRLR